MSSIKPKASYLKYKDTALLYDRDLLGTQQLIRIRLIEAHEIPTPVTSAYMDRFTSDNPFSVPARNFNPRRVLACFQLDGKAVERTVYIPYKATDSNHNYHIKQVINYGNNLQTVNYFGESQEKGLETYA
ncbi:hypothetical protein C7H19_23690 [Aphanothece hegewaldii CCALA 016]|uniref:Uncharacterized protein n=1 Tax=Aphanothece hegewaldii CCALA 016 TaxID=2107694 RepID=A0A2T1LRD8_9CHRO|nr:hypothetical protein [Aphanothece hegewaldii]PSF30587.1 hypothetical protein C7H19_23690 [Aphanothece hegewaldii CCALA 016]